MHGLTTIQKIERQNFEAQQIMAQHEQPKTDAQPPRERDYSELEV